MMTKEQHLAEKEYRIARRLMLRMLSEKLISEQEFAIIDTTLREKCRPIIGTFIIVISLAIVGKIVVVFSAFDVLDWACFSQL